MDHRQINDLELLEYVAGRLSASRRSELDSILAKSPADRGRLEQLGWTWRALGQWDVRTAGLDVRDDVMRRIRRRRTAGFPFGWGVAARAAAVWLVAICAGMATGLLAPRYFREADSAPVSVQEADVAEALQLSALGAGGSTGLAQWILEADGPGEQETEQ